MKNLKWQEWLTIASLVALATYLILHFANPLFQNYPLFFLIAIGGIPLALQIIFKIFKGDIGADLLAFIGLVTAIYLGEYLASALIILMLASGQALENYATNKASFALEALAKRMPSIAHKIVDDEVLDIAISEIKIGDLLEIYPHETCPIDGVVVLGHGSMDESYLTGEPYQITKSSGSHVLSGAINGNSLLRIKAEKLAKDSRYANIMKVMESAENNRPAMRRLADKIGAIFAPFAFIFALLTLYFTGDIKRFLSVLVVATPCPLLIAIPITIISAISIAARRGIIIRNPVILEKLPICQTAIFDKTGTLTYGKPDLVEIITFNNFLRSDILQMAASLEKYSRHPLSIAIIEAAKKENITTVKIKNIAEEPGKGLVGNLDGKEIKITSRNKISFEIANNLPKTKHGLECVILVNEQLAGLLSFRDVPRDEGHFFINHLGPHHNFNKIILLSGDRESEVEHLAQLLGIKDIYFEKKPEEKLEIVKIENKKAPTLFMGDGINDAPALAVATVGIAFGQHNSITSEAAGAVIMENNLNKVDELIHISESMRNIALQSAVGGMIFSFGGMILAALGIINPVEGALLQEIIDVVAILNALRMTWESSVAADV